MAGDWDVDVVDVRSLPRIEEFEKEKLRFYIIQTLRVLPNLRAYDLIISHGMQSGVVLSLWRRLFKTKAKHIVFDIGSFASASESGTALKLMQTASKSIDGLIYHTSSQIDYYRKFFPWLVEKSKFIPFGTDLDFFEADDVTRFDDGRPYFTCIGSLKRDWDTLVKAYCELDTDIRLKIIGHVDDRFGNVPGIDMIPFVPVQEMRSYIKGALFCALPLEVHNYSYGQMTLMQQMAMGKCVVAAKAPSLVDYAAVGESAVFYRPLDVNDCAEKLQLVIKDTAFRERIAAFAPIWLRRERNEEKMAHEIENYIYNCLRGLYV